MILALLAALQGPVVTTKDYAVETHGALKVVWDDHWFEVADGQIWLVTRMSYTGDWRFYDRASWPGVIDNRKAEAGERQGDDCRKVGFIKACRHTENVRIALSRAEVQRMAESAGPVTLEYLGMTQKPAKVEVDPKEARLLLSRME